jgi:RNA polymerase sigma factor (sigma-70 family)
MEAQALPRTGRLFLPRSRKLLSAFSDERLVEQVRRGNDDAFEAIFDRHHRAILSFCRHMLASADEAEDAVQQTFISAFDALRADARDIRLKAWLYTIARNRCLSILRGRREQPAELDEVPTAGLADEVQQRSDLRDLLDDLRELPVDQRAALVLSELGDLSHAEVGDVVGCEAAKVKSLVFQARSSLIETRRARDIPCGEIREQLATATGGALRRAPLRRHLRTCTGCAEFRDEVMRQRRALAMILPVVPSIGLKKSALAAIGVGGGGGAGGAAVGLSGGGGIASLASSGVAAKVVGAVVVAGVAVGGGLVLDKSSPAPPAQAAEGPPSGPADVAQLGHARGTGPGARVRAVARHQGGRGKALRQRGNHAGGKGARNHSGPGNTRRTGGAVGGKPATHNTPVGQTGPGATVTAPPASATVGPPANSNAGGNGNGNSNAGGNGNGGGNGGGANNGNHTGWEHSAHGGQGVGNGGDPPGTAPSTPSANAGPPPNSNAGGNGNGNANGHVKNGKGA